MINRWTHPWKYEVPLGDLLHDEVTPFPANYVYLEAV